MRLAITSLTHILESVIRLFYYKKERKNKNDNQEN